MIRSLAFVVGIGVISAPVAASSYAATLASPVSGRFIARDIVWNCGAEACQGVTDESRPAVICQSLAKQAGRIESFIVDGRALAANELDRCNGSAKAARADASSGK